MSKTGWIILIAAICLVLCLCFGLALAGRISSAFSSGVDSTYVDKKLTDGFKSLNNPYEPSGIYRVKAESIKDLDVNWVAGSVTIQLTDETDIVIQESSTKPLSERVALRYGISGNKLRVQYCKKSYVGKISPKDLVISLPRTLAEGLKECEVSAVSCSVSIADLTTEEISVESVSGAVLLENIVTSELEIDAVSGKIEILSTTAKSLRVDTISSSITVDGTIKNAKLSSVSGGATLNLDGCEKARCSTVSGPLTVCFVQCPDEVKVDTTSSDVRIQLPPDANIRVDMDSMSGSLYLNEEKVSNNEIVLHEGSARCSVDTMSGNAYIITK